MAGVPGNAPMRPYTDWGGIEPASASSESKDLDDDSLSLSRSDGSPLERRKDSNRFKRVPATMQSYFKEVEFQKNKSTSSAQSDDTDRPLSNEYSSDQIDTNHEVAVIRSKSEFYERIAAKQTVAASESCQTARSSAHVDEDFGGDVSVSVEDRMVFERVVAEVGLWSKGCDLHRSGRCRPCHFVHCKAGCSNGSNCEFCHLPHIDKNKQRPDMCKRLYIKHISGLLENACRGDAEKFEQVIRASASISPYFHATLLARRGGGRVAGGFEPSSNSGGARGTRANIVSL